MKKAVIYARQSSGDEDQSASVDQQILNCKRLAADQDLQIIDVFSDLNISGKTYPDTTEALALAAVDEAYKSWVNSTYLKTHKYRKGLAQVLGVLKSVDYVLLDDFTRLMRPLPASYLESHVVQKLKSAGVKVWCVKGGITDLSNFADNLVASLISQINANQIEIQRQKSIAALRTLKDSGYRTNGANFYGYRYVKEQTYEMVPEEADLVRIAFELGIQGVPFVQICRLLGKELGKESFSRNTLDCIYRRPEYAGFQYNSQGELIESKCFKDMPIITFSQFSQMQDRLNSRRIHNHDRKEVYAFTGLCYCGHCGERMSIKFSGLWDETKEPIKPRFFACVKNIFRADYKPECGLSSIRYQYYKGVFEPETMERKPVTDLKKVLIPTELRSCGLYESLMPLITVPLLEEKKRLLISQDVQDRIAKLEEEKQKQIDYEKKLGKMLLEETIDDAQFAVMAAGSKEKKENISKEIIALMSQSSINRQEEEERIDELLYLLQLKKIDKFLYKKYAQITISRINLFADYIVIEFTNGKKLKLEKMRKKCARILPNWSLEVKKGKAYIKYYYKSFYSGDNSESLLYNDECMRIVSVGNNEGYKPRPLPEATRVILKR